METLISLTQEQCTERNSLLSESNNVLFFDVETTIFNKGHPFDPRNFLVSYAYTFEHDIVFRYYTDPDFIYQIQRAINSADCVCGFNIKFDIHWLTCIGVIIPLHVKIWDCQLAEFIYSGQELPYDSLNEALERYGLPIKKDVVKEYWDQGISTEFIPIPILEEYNNWDVETTRMLFNTQQALLSEQQRQLVYLEGEDLRALQAAEYAGIKFDVERAAEELEVRNRTLADIERKLSEFLPSGIPVGLYNFDSGDHLSALLYGATLGFDVAEESPAVYQSGEKKGQSYIRRKWKTVPVEFPQRFKPLPNTEFAKCLKDGYQGPMLYQTDTPTLIQLTLKAKGDNKTLLSLLNERSASKKVVEMIESILNKMKEKNWQNDMIHAQFNQNVVITGRLSSSQPNLQNTPLEVDALLISRYAD